MERRTGVTNEDLDQRLRAHEEKTGQRLAKIEAALFDKDGKSVLKNMLEMFQFSKTTIRIMMVCAVFVGPIIGLLTYFKSK